MFYHLVRTVVAEDILSGGRRTVKKVGQREKMHTGAKSDLIEWNWQILFESACYPNCQRLRSSRKPIPIHDPQAALDFLYLLNG